MSTSSVPSPPFADVPPSLLPLLFDPHQSHFLSSPFDADLCCSICSHLCFGPIVAANENETEEACAHLFCKQEIHRWLIHDGNTRCPAPGCSNSLTWNQCRIDVRVKKRIASLQCRCFNASKGCQWTGAFGADGEILRQHVGSCVYSNWLKCQYHYIGCQFRSLDQSELSAHEVHAKDIHLQLACQRLAKQNNIDFPQQIQSNTSTQNPLSNPAPIPVPGGAALLSSVSSSFPLVSGYSISSSPPLPSHSLHGINNHLSYPQSSNGTLVAAGSLPAHFDFNSNRAGPIHSDPFLIHPTSASILPTPPFSFDTSVPSSPFHTLLIDGIVYYSNLPYEYLTSPSQIWQPCHLVGTAHSGKFLTIARENGTTFQLDIQLAKVKLRRKAEETRLDVSASSSTVEKKNPSQDGAGVTMINSKSNQQQETESQSEVEDQPNGENEFDEEEEETGEPEEQEDQEEVDKQAQEDEEEEEIQEQQFWHDYKEEDHDDDDDDDEESQDRRGNGRGHDGAGDREGDGAVSVEINGIRYVQGNPLYTLTNTHIHKSNSFHDFVGRDRIKSFVKNQRTQISRS